MNDKPEDERPKGRGRRDAPRGAGPRDNSNFKRPPRASSPRDEREGQARGERSRTGRFKDKDAGEGRPEGRSFGAKRVGEKPRFGKKPVGGKPFGAKSRFGENSSEDRPFGRLTAPRDGASSEWRRERPAGDARRPPRGPRAEGDARSEGKPFGSKPRFADKPRFGEKPKGGADRADFKARKPARRPTSAVGDEEGQSDGRERIAKVMARAGVASRRDAEVMIEEGRVAVNGEVLTTPATLVGPDDKIAIDGAAMPSRDRTRLWFFHKPRGLVTTARDPEGRPTVFEALPPDMPRVVTVGRLDINTEGLLLLTNDGGLAKVLAHPTTGWLRRYRVRAFGEIDQAILDTLADGVTVDGMHYGPIEAKLERAQGDNVWLMLGLREGKNREVKRVLEHLGLRVNRLIRVSFGPFQLGDLGEGAVEELRTAILRDQLGPTLAAEAGVDFEGSVTPPARDPRPARGERSGERLERDAERGNEGFEDRAGGKGRGRDDLGRPSRSIWRDEETEAARPQGKRLPRRGSDPQTARQESAAREHRRGSPVSDPKGRRVLVERIVSAPAEPKPARRSSRSFHRDEAEGASRRVRDGADARPKRSGAEGRSFGDRPAGGKSLGGKSFGGKSFGGKSFGAKSFTGKGRDEGGAKSFGGTASPARPGGKSFGGKSVGGKSVGGKPAGGKSGGRPGGGRGKPGGFSGPPRRPRSS